MARSVKAVRRHHVHVKSAHSRKAKGRLAQRKRERKLNWQLNTVNSDGSAPKKIQVSTSAREQKQNVLSPEEIEERAQKRLLKKQQKELDRQAASTSAAQANELRRQQKEERRARQAEEGAKKVEEAARKREEAKAAAAAAAAEAAAKANEAKQQRKAEEEQRRKQKAESPVKEKPPADESASSKGSKKNKKEKEESAKVNDDAAPAEPNKANDANVEEPEVQVSRVDASEGAKPDAGKKKEKKSKKHQDSATFEREATPVAETEPVQNVFAAPTNDQPAAVDNQEVTAPKDDSKKKSKKQKSKSPEVDVVTAAAAAEPEPQTVAAETQEQAVVDTNGTPTNEPLEVETLSKSAEETAVEDAPVAKFSQQNGHEESVPTPQGVEVGEEALEDVQKVDRHQEAEQPSKKNKKKGKNQRVSESEGQTDNSDNVKPAEAPIDNAQVEEAKSSETSPAEQAAEVQQTAEVQENAEPATESKEGGHSKKDKKNKGKKHQESESGAPHEAENVNDQEAVAEEVHEKKKGKKDKKKHESETEAAPQEEVAVAAAPIESGPSVIEEKANPVFTTEKAPEEFDFFDFLPEKKPAVDETSAPEVTAPSDAPEQESAPSKETEEVAVPNKNTQDVVEEKPKQCFVTEKAPEDFDFFDFLPEKKSETTVDVAAASEEVSAPSESSKAETAAVDASASEEAAAPSEKSTVEPGLVDAGTPEKIAAPSESVQNAVEEKPKQCFVTEKAPEDFDFFDFLPEKKSETTVDDAEALVEVTENADNAKAVAEEANYAEAPADETPEEGSKKSKKGKKDKKHRESEGESAPQETTLPHENVEAVVDEQVSQAEVALDEAPEEGSKKSRKGKKDKKHRQSETESTPHDAAVPNENAGAVAEEANYAVDAAADEGFEDGSKKSKKGKKDKKHRESETEAGHQEVHVSNETAQAADEQPNNVEAAADEPHEDGPKKSRRGKRGRHEKQASKETTPVDDSAAVYEPVEVTPSQPDVVAAPEADYAAAVSEEATGDVHDKAEEGHGDFETKKGKRTRHHKKHGSKEATPVEAEGASGPNHEDEHAESGTVNVDETAEPEPVAHEDEHKSKDSKKGKHRKQKSSESNEVADAPAPEHTEGGKHKRGGGRRGRNSNSRTSESSQPGDVPAEEEPSHVQEPIAEEQEKKGADDHEHGHQKHRRGKKGKHQNHDEEPLEKLQTSLGPVDGELGNQKVNGDSAASPSEDFVVVRYERNEFAEPPPSESSPAQSPEIVEDGFEVVNTGKQQGKKGGKKGKKFEQQLANALEIAAEVEGTTKTTAPDLAPNGFQEEFLIDNFVNEDEQHGKKKKNKRGKNASQSEEKLVPGQTELKEAPLDVATETTQEEKEPSSPPLQVNEVSSTAHEDSNGSQAASGAQSPVTETITAQAEISQEDAESPTKFAQNVQRLVESTIGTVDPTKKLTINAQLIKLAEKKPPVILFESKPVVLAIERHSQSPKFEQRSFRDRVYKLLPKDILFCAGMLDKYGEDFDAMAKDASNVYKETPRSLQRKIRIFRESPHFEVYQKAKAEGRELSELLH